MLVFADHGAGKTVLGGSMNEKALIIATENGTISAKRMGSKARVVRVEDWKQLESTFKWIKAQLTRNGGVLEFEGQEITWIVIDTATEMQDLCIRYILDTAHAANASRDIDIPAIQDYMKWQNAFKRFIKAFNDLPINVLWLAASLQEENEDGDTVVRPAFNGRNGTSDPSAMSKWVCGTVHAYGHLTVRIDKETRKDYRRLIFRRPFGKDRYGVLSPYIDNPTLPEIEGRITGTPVEAATSAKSTRPRRTATRESE